MRIFGWCIGPCLVTWAKGRVGFFPLLPFLILYMIIFMHQKLALFCDFFSIFKSHFVWVKGLLVCGSAKISCIYYKKPKNSFTQILSFVKTTHILWGVVYVWFILISCGDTQKFICFLLFGNGFPSLVHDQEKTYSHFVLLFETNGKNPLLRHVHTLDTPKIELLLFLPFWTNPYWLQ